MLRDRLGRSGQWRVLYIYEILNPGNGRRNVGEIPDIVSAAIGPPGLDLVLDYLQACSEAGIINLK